jgi:hypothetical protein
MLETKSRGYLQEKSGLMANRWTDSILTALAARTLSIVSMVIHSFRDIATYNPPNPNKQFNPTLCGRLNCRCHVNTTGMM